MDRPPAAGGWHSRGLSSYSPRPERKWILRPPDRGTPPRAERQEYAPYTGPLEFPEMMDRAPAEIRELYVFAARRPDVMHYVPCFCGCWRVGHKDAYDCFIDEVHDDGRVEIDQMGFT